VPLAVAAIVAVLAVAVWVVGFTGVLGVRTVAVGGVRSLSADQIRAAAAVRRGEPLARVDTGAVERRIRQLAGVARVAVARSWPGTLRITVTERRGVAVVTRDGAAWLIDGEGVVFQRLATRPRSVPRLDVPCRSPDEPACHAALSALTSLPPAVARAVLSVAAPTPDSVTLALTDGRVALWGSADQGTAKAQALAALLRQPGKRYDVSTPSVVTVR
jgi:cell division protein FtsQ